MYSIIIALSTNIMDHLNRSLVYFILTIYLPALIDKSSQTAIYIDGNLDIRQVQKMALPIIFYLA